MRLKKKVKKNKSDFDIVCLDTGVILGYGLKIINKIKKDSHPLKKLKEIKEDGILKKVKDKTKIRFVTIITSYEFINNMSRRHGVSIDLARKVYESIKEEFQIVEIIPKPKEINLSPKLMNDLCKCELDLADGLQIYIASLRKLTFVTSEKKKVPKMKKFYSEVINVKELLSKTN